MASRMIVCHEKHGEGYYEASTDEEWAESALKILTKRFNEGYWYYDPRQEDHPFSLQRRKEAKESAALELEDAQFEALPETVRDQILEARHKYAQERREDERQIEEYEAIKKVVEDQDYSWITYGKDTRWAREIPLAWDLLESRSDHEYERVELIEAGSFS